MPTQKKKVKKPKEDTESKAPAANVKQEPEELKPLSAYVDDRLELIRQVFSCVKPKEIKYLLPDFLEGKSNDVIKERCLDELLGISTKRLHSIIQNTKCPTDTESSSEGSDVEKIEEHISLDEISSDSDVDSKRTTKRNKKADGSKQGTEERNGEPKSEKEMTVLELLELQARARAIRSQLALEPVTKIEIDSEHEAEDGRHGDVDTDDETKLPARARTGSKASDGAKNGTQFKSENNAQQLTKRVRLKRNFRIRKVGDEDDDEQELSSNPPDTGREKSTELAMEAMVEEEQEKAPESSPQQMDEKMEEDEEEKRAPSVTQAEEEKQTEPDSSAVEKETETNTAEANADTNVPVTATEATDATQKDDADAEPPQTVRANEEGDRESSPEVIPVEASPETLCISSDSEEERLAKERASIFVPNIEELDRQAKKPPTPVPAQPAEDTEPEEGEISEDEEQPPEPEPAAVPEEQPTEDKEQTGDAEDTIQMEIAEGEEPAPDAAVEQDKAKADTIEAEEATAKDKSVVLSSGSSDEGDSGGSSSSDSSSSSEAEQDDAKDDAPTKLDHSAQDDHDIVEIHDSGDETLLLEDKPPEEEAKSWNSRWLKSNRVAKVMAASRLGNKVREKLKKKKQIQQAAEQQQQQQQQQEKPADGPEVSSETIANAGDTTTTPTELPANVELGSVEHYRELIAQQENKQN
ncbi:caldesmon [Anopheles merus]|uniref:caldesmon n=1 Tax=Anopheles merus TaxID=30066 RepID=UPI001BE3D018|nr:caldesmon [Anopheles merus]